MVAQVVWSPEATEDLESIAAFIERDSHWYATAVISKLVGAAESVLEFPSLGRVVPELNDPSIRERFVYSYRLIYQIHDDTAVVIAIVHGRRMLEPAISHRVSE